MIEKLFPEEYPLGEPAYSIAEKEISEIVRRLEGESGTINADLERLDAAYHRQCSAAVKDAFTKGFCTAVELMTDVLQEIRSHSQQ